MNVVEHGADSTNELHGIGDFRQFAAPGLNPPRFQCLMRGGTGDCDHGGIWRPWRSSRYGAERQCGAAPGADPPAPVGGWIATAALTMVFVNSELAGEAVVLLIGLLTIGAGVWIVLRAVLLRHAPWSWSIAAFAVLASKPRPKYCATCSSR